MGSTSLPAGQTNMVSSRMNINVHSFSRYSLFKWSRDKVGSVPQFSVSAVEDVVRGQDAYIILYFA